MLQVFPPPTTRCTTTVEAETLEAANWWECVLVLHKDAYLHVDFGGVILPASFVAAQLGSLPQHVKVRFGSWYGQATPTRVVVTQTDCKIVASEVVYPLPLNTLWRHMRACSWEYLDEETFTAFLLSVAETEYAADPFASEKKKARLREYELLRSLDKTIDEIIKDTTTGPLPSVANDVPVNEYDLERLGVQIHENGDNIL